MRHSERAPRLEPLETRRLLAAAVDGPTVLSVQRMGVHHQPTVLVVQFSQPLNPLTAQNPSSYFLFNFKSRPVGIRSAQYDPATQSVTLFPGQRVNLHRPAPFLVVGIGPTAVTNSAGVALDGARTGQPGSNFSTQLTRQNLS
jgi:hypothetical protein